MRSILLSSGCPGSSSTKKCRVMREAEEGEAEDVSDTEDVYVPVDDGDTYRWRRHGVLHALSNTGGVYNMSVGDDDNTGVVFADGQAGDTFNAGLIHALLSGAHTRMRTPCSRRTRA